MKKQTLADLKAKYSESERTALPNNYYPFYSMKEGERCVIRFLPDRNEDNPFGFLVSKIMHNLEINGEKNSVPCLSMYGDDCPICKVSQDFYKIKDETNGKKYWKKKQYIAQCIVIEDPLPPNESTGETHEGKLRFINLGYQIYQIIQDAFKSDDTLESIPYNFEDGYDFIIKKTKQGEYATYAIGSKFHSKQRALTDDELAVFEESAVDLSSLLPKNPGKEKVEAMLSAAVSGNNYQEEDEDDIPTPPKKAVAPKPAPARPVIVDDEDEEEEAPKPRSQPAKPVKAAAEDDGSSDVENMLAEIRSRRKKQSDDE